MKMGRVRNKPHGWIVGAQWGLASVDGVTKRKVVQTFSVDARVVRVIVAENSDLKWASAFAGTSRLAVEVHLVTGDIDETFYLDNEDGETPIKLTVGHGHPEFTLKQLPVCRIVDDPTIARIYKCQLSKKTITPSSTKDGKNPANPGSGEARSCGTHALSCSWLSPSQSS